MWIYGVCVCAQIFAGQQASCPNLRKAKIIQALAPSQVHLHTWTHAWGSLLHLNMSCTLLGQEWPMNRQCDGKSELKQETPLPISTLSQPFFPCKTTPFSSCLPAPFPSSCHFYLCFKRWQLDATAQFLPINCLVSTIFLPASNIWPHRRRRSRLSRRRSRLRLRRRSSRRRSSPGTVMEVYTW